MLIEKPIPIGYVLRMVRIDVPVVLAMSTTFTYMNSALDQHLPDIPTALPAFMGTAISLLLSFKLNQSYDRWWEARKIWGAIVNDSRTLARQVLSFPETATERSKVMVMRQIGWCYCLGEQLRGRPWLANPPDAISVADVAEARTHANAAVALLQQQARDLDAMARQKLVTNFERVAVDATLSRLTDHMGKAERIRTTVFPTTYRMFLHIAIYLFIVVLTLAIENVGGYWTVPLAVVIAIIFFFLEKTAIHLQDPFRDSPTDTPVTAIARTIEINLRQLLGQKEVPQPAKPDGFYLM